MYEGQDKNPEMCRVLLTHEVMCRYMFLIWCLCLSAKLILRVNYYERISTDIFHNVKLFRAHRLMLFAFRYVSLFRVCATLVA